MCISNKRILVTGGAGFIGSNLIEYLLLKGNQIVCLDNFSTGKRENIQFFLNNKNFKLIEGDIRSLDICIKVCDGIDYVFHEAALGSVPRSIKDPISSTEVNVLGTLNMLVAARDAKVKRFIYAASSSTYGDSSELPKREDRIGKPLSPYAITKYVNELYAENFFRLYGLESIGLRYFNVFGRRQDPNGAYAAVIPRFVLSLIRQESPYINGDGTYSRDFTYIDNVIQANELAALVPYSKLKTQNPKLSSIFNIACGERTTLNELFYTLRQALSEFDQRISCIEPQYRQVREGDIPHSLADISKAKNIIGYNTEISVKNGLMLSADWYYNYLS